MKFYYALLSIIVLSLVFWMSPFEKSKDLELNFSSRPEEYMSQVTVWNFTEEGRLKHYLSVSHWAYLPEKSSSILRTPYLTVYKPDNTIWNIHAKIGKITQPSIGRIDQVELLENVVLERPATRLEMPIKVETEMMRYQPKKQYAETDQLITLTKPDLTMTGVGMRAFLDKSLVELLHNVKTSYKPG